MKPTKRQLALASRIHKIARAFGRAVELFNEAGGDVQLEVWQEDGTAQVLHGATGEIVVSCRVVANADPEGAL